MWTKKLKVYCENCMFFDVYTYPADAAGPRFTIYECSSTENGKIRYRKVRDFRSERMEPYSSSDKPYYINKRNDCKWYRQKEAGK